MNFGRVLSGELSLLGEEEGEGSSQGVAQVGEVFGEAAGDGLGVRNMPRGTGRPRSTGTALSFVSLGAMK